MFFASNAPLMNSRSMERIADTFPQEPLKAIGTSVVEVEASVCICVVSPLHVVVVVYPIICS
jgi:hypothetical protein